MDGVNLLLSHAYCFMNFLAMKESKLLQGDRIREEELSTLGFYFGDDVINVIME
jgi:hypothetical protein